LGDKTAPGTNCKKGGQCSCHAAYHKEKKVPWVEQSLLACHQKIVRKNVIEGEGFVLKTDLKAPFLMGGYTARGGKKVTYDCQKK